MFFVYNKRFVVSPNLVLLKIAADLVPHQIRQY
jgi:hypothetical protein